MTRSEEREEEVETDVDRCGNEDGDRPEVGLLRDQDADLHHEGHSVEHEGEADDGDDGRGGVDRGEDLDQDRGHVSGDAESIELVDRAVSRANDVALEARVMQGGPTLTDSLLVQPIVLQAFRCLLLLRKFENEARFAWDTL